MRPPLADRYGEDSRAMLRLTTFGGLSLRGEGGEGATADPPLPRRGLALLALLAAGPDAGVSRDSIVAYLGPESDEEHARNALRQTLFTLRRELRLPDLFAGGAELSLNPAVVSTDIRDYDVAEEGGRLEEAVRIYGGPFLDGFHLGGSPEFEHWADRRRAEYARRTAEALEALARASGRRGDHAAATAWWRRLVATDPLNTRYVLESMAAEAAAGNPAAALRQAQTHEELLRREVGAAPDRALAELAGRIRNGESIPPRPPSAGPVRPGAPLPSPAAPPGRFRDRLARELAGRFLFEDTQEEKREGSVRLFAARDPRHERRVTLKVLHPALASQIDVERFLREIRFTGKLLHPHILPLLDSGEVGGRPWFALPAPDGETLRTRLTRDGAVPGPEAVKLCLELADALGYAHASGIVHRGVAPENVLLSGGHALLTNLGVARALDSAGGATLTDAGMLVGAAAYMSPEQAESPRGVDGRSDQYSLAAVLFEMLTGEPLFSGPTSSAILVRRAAEPVPDTSRLAGVPARIVAVLRRALAEDPGGRYETMGQLATALREASPAGDPGVGRS
jgi:DNA-binding SARP family transcriptional activator